MEATEFSKDELSHVDYGLSQVFRFKWLLLFIFLLILGFALTYPVKEKVETGLRTALSSNNKCPIYFGDLSYNWFPPAINLTQINLPASCSDKTLKDLEIPKVTAGFGGISFSPFGLVSSVDIYLLKQPISAKIVVGIGNFALKIDRNLVNLTGLMSLLQEPYKIAGDAELSTRIVFENQTIHEGDIRLQSENLILPSQNIKGFETPSLNVNTLDLILEIPEGDNNYNLRKLTVGNADSPLRVNGSGTIKADPQNFNNSDLDIRLELAPSRSLLDQFLILESLLSPYNLKDGFYRIKLGGKLSRPSPSSF